MFKRKLEYILTLILLSSSVTASVPSRVTIQKTR